MNTKHMKIAADARAPYARRILELEAQKAELLAALRVLADSCDAIPGSPDTTAARAAIAKAVQSC